MPGQLPEEVGILFGGLGKETAGGESRVYRAHYKASIRYINLLEGSYNGNYPPENVLELRGFSGGRVPKAILSAAGFYN